jgi:hypothetical protein
MIISEWMYVEDKLFSFDAYVSEKRRRVMTSTWEPVVNFTHNFILRFGRDWAHSVRRALFGQLYQPGMMVADECGTVGGTIVRGNQNTRRKPAQPHFVNHKSQLIWDRTRTTVVGSQRLTVWAMERPWAKFNRYLDRGWKRVQTLVDSFRLFPERFLN